MSLHGRDRQCLRCCRLAPAAFDQEARSQHLPRLLVASTVAGMVYLQLMLPCVPQLLNYFRTERALGEIGLRWHKNMGAHLLAGIPWNNSDTPSAGYQELQWAAEAHPHVFLLLRLAALACLVLGALRLGLSRPAGWIALAVLLLPGPLVYIVSRSKNHYLYEWYLLFTLSGLVGFVSLGLDWVTGLARRVHRFAPPLLAGLAVTTFIVVTQPQRRWLVTHSLQPMREAVLLTRPSLDPYDPRQKAPSQHFPSPEFHGRTIRTFLSSPASRSLSDICRSPTARAGPCT